MLKVTSYEIIRREHIVKRKSINSLSQEYHHSKRTIRKILDNIVPPGYRRKKAIRLPVIGPVKEWIDNILEKDKDAPRKQRHTAHRIYNRLKEEKGYRGCESGIRHYVGKWKRSETGKESYVRLAYSPGVDAQADFGVAEAIMKGERQNVHVLSLRLCYSTKSMQVSLPGETQECVFEGLRRIFEEIGGVPQNIWFDNFPAAVSSVLKMSNRIETENFIGFRSHYLFAAVFCAPGKGNEKGHAETLVGYGRRNFMSPVPEVASYEELNHRLMHECRADEDRKKGDRRVGDLFEEERDRLLKLPARQHPCRVLHKAKVNKFQEVEYAKKLYSVPMKYVGQEVWLHVGAFEIEIEFEDRVIVKKRRVYRADESGIDPRDYLDILERKSRAVSHARVLKEWKLPEVFQRLHLSIKKKHAGSEGDREYIRILKLTRDFEMDILAVAAELALEYQSVGSDAVRSLCHQLASSNEKPMQIDLSDSAETIQNVHSWTPNLKAYDRLLTGVQS
jgi:transposase